MYTIRLENHEQVGAALGAIPKQVRRAARRTVRQLVNEGHKQLARNIPKAAGTPIMPFRRIRAKKRLPKGRQQSSRGSIWMGTNKIPAAYVGKLRNDPDRGGAWAGKYFFENSFVAKMSSGYESIFQRIGKTGKLKQRYVHLPKASANAAAIARKLEGRLQEVLRSNLELELSKKKR